jgi:hypothetical protein
MSPNSFEEGRVVNESMCAILANDMVENMYVFDM